MELFHLCPSAPKGFLLAFNIYVQKERFASTVPTLGQINALCVLLGCVEICAGVMTWHTE
jgi:hypothetical protein